MHAESLRLPAARACPSLPRGFAALRPGGGPALPELQQLLACSLQELAAR